MDYIIYSYILLYGLHYLQLHITVSVWLRIPLSVSPCREEAQSVWEKREAEWEKERKARERLMREVNLFTSDTL